MRSYRKELWFHTDKRREFVNITPKWRTACAKAASGKVCAW